MSVMANFWASQGHLITLMTIGPLSWDWYPLHPTVRRIALDLYSHSAHFGEAITYNVRRILGLRRALRRSHPDAIISFGELTNMKVLMAAVGLGCPVVVSERSEPIRHPIPCAWRWLRRLLYPWADALVLQTEALRGWGHGLIKSEKVHVIHNPVGVARAQSPNASLGKEGEHILIAVGRLGWEKGYDLLIEAFGRCAGRYKTWKLMIVGEGEQRKLLEAQVMCAGLADQVLLTGRVADPVPLLKGADLFALTSRYEGFPNVLLEAMACGLPVIAADCPNGPREIVRHGVDGILIPTEDVEHLTAALDRLMGDPDERQLLGARAIEVIDRFGVELVMKQWDRLLEQVGAGTVHLGSMRRMAGRSPGLETQL